MTKDELEAIKKVSLKADSLIKRCDYLAQWGKILNSPKSITIDIFANRIDIKNEGTRENISDSLATADARLILQAIKDTIEKLRAATAVELSELRVN